MIKNIYKNLFYILTSIFLILFVVLIFWQEPIEYLQQFITDNSVLSISIFIFLMFISTVFVPITVLPLVPFVAILLGYFDTMIYSIIGWTLGSIVAFLIARHMGKPILFKFIKEEYLIKYHKYVPENISFWWVVFLRMMIPVDILSYAVGLITNMSLWKYTLATIIGITPFSFIFSYGHEIIFLNNIYVVILVVIFLIAIFSLMGYFHKKGKL